VRQKLSIKSGAVSTTPAQVKRSDTRYSIGVTLEQELIDDDRSLNTYCPDASKHDEGQPRTRT